MNRLKIFLLSGVLIFCSGFTEITPVHIKTKGFDGYIFPKEYILTAPICNMKDRFTPTAQDVAKAELLLKTQLPEVNSSLINQGNGNPIVHKALKKYKRQYVGFIDNTGDSIIWINFIWKNQVSESFSKDIMIVLDGSSYFWNVKVNCNKNRVFDLQVNGPS